MDEAEMYQQRLQAIAERRRQQEEEKKLRRETDEEWLKTAQRKRKNLREQWLSETAPAPVLPSLDSSRPRPPPQDEADKHTAAEQTKSQKTPEDEEEDEAADAKEEKQAFQEENKESINCTAAARTHNHYQAGTDEDVQVNKEAEDHFTIQMAQRMFHENGQDGRSVLGTLAVQVEKDPRTGATVVRSVAPVLTPAGAPTATTVFDDGRKSIHAVGGVGGQPSTEELGQILSVIDGVGMKVLLDEVTVTPNKAETKTENVDANRAPEGKVLSFSTCHAISEEDSTQLDSSRSHDLEAELRREDCAVSMGNEEDKKEDRSITAVRDIAGEVGYVEDQMLEEGPVTLLFLGYADATTDQGNGQEDHEGMLTVERVMITEEGEEHVLGPETSASPQEGKESQDQVFQDIPLEGNGAGVKVQGEEGDKELHNSSLPSIAEGGGSKRKTCQCCSVM
ncbi:paralemmin-2-like [Morone saxatilis]|uniref:paralemmin-2-like n=1 Tax=Morone saxatilis TaxID=34816 RepID=UPI0015E21E97|nr:paralemmin-2-like [Morone saxatilis]